MERNQLASADLPINAAADVMSRGIQTYEHPILSTLCKYVPQNGRFHATALLIIPGGQNGHCSCAEITFRMPQRLMKLVHNERSICNATNRRCATARRLIAPQASLKKS